MHTAQVEAVRRELHLRDQELKRQAGSFPANSPAVCTPRGTGRAGSCRAAAAGAGADGEAPQQPLLASTGKADSIWGDLKKK